MSLRYHHGALRTGLLEAAEAILNRDGIAALTLRATAREAGVSHAAPTHHFGDLTGLQTALAASGFIRLRAHLDAELAVAADPASRLTTLGRGYVAFARTFPGLFLLMFRAERLDWTSPALLAAGEGMFELLFADAHAATPSGRDLPLAMTRWSLMHGLSILLIDGRLEAMADKVGVAEVDGLIGAVVEFLNLTVRPVT